MIEPDLICSVLCDDVRREDNGKLILIGLFENIACTQFPSVHPMLCIVNKWGKGGGQFRERTRILAPEDEVIIENLEVSFELRDLDASYTRTAIFQRVPLPQAGRYVIEVLLNGELKQRYPFYVVQA